MEEQMIMRILKLLKYFSQVIYFKNYKKSDQYHEVIYNAVKDLGGVYIKLIQFVCLRTDVFPNDQKIKFLSFYDAVPSESLDVTRVLLKELGEKKAAQFNFVSDQPFASGTFGQVYHAQLINGKKVIIKMKRPHLRLKLLADFLVLKIAMRIFNLVYYQRIIDTVKLLKEFEHLTYKELDYITEAKNAQYFCEIYQNHPQVFIPETYPHLCSDNILTQEYVGGISLTDLIRYKETRLNKYYNEWLIKNYQTNMQDILRSLAYELAIQGLYYPYFYADPHPGNIKILPHNRYALIDFGIVGDSPGNKRNYYHIISLIIQKAQNLDMKSLGREFLKWGAGDFYKCIQTLDDYFGKNEGKLTHAITEKYQELLERKREKFRQIEVREQENFAKMYLDILQAGQNLQVRLPDGLLAMLRTIAIYKSWNEFLEPDLHHMRDTYKHLLNQVNVDSLINTEDIQRNPIEIEEAIEKVLDWTENVAEFDLPFYYKISRKLHQIYV